MGAEVEKIRNWQIYVVLIQQFNGKVVGNI